MKARISKTPAPAPHSRLKSSNVNQGTSPRSVKQQTQNSHRLAERIWVSSSTDTDGVGQTSTACWKVFHSADSEIVFQREGFYAVCDTDSNYSGD